MVFFLIFQKKKIERLQKIQNQAARMLKRIPRRNHITPVLKDLHWLRINERIEYKILILTHRAFSGFKWKNTLYSTI